MSGNRTDTYTADGTIERPYKTLPTLVAGFPSSGLVSVFSSPNASYTASSAATLPALPTTIYGNNSTWTFSGGVTVNALPTTIYDLNTVGATTYSACGSTIRSERHGGSYSGGNVTLGAGCYTHFYGVNLSGNSNTLNVNGLLYGEALTGSMKIASAGTSSLLAMYNPNMTKSSGYNIDMTAGGQLLFSGGLLSTVAGTANIYLPTANTVSTAHVISGLITGTGTGVVCASGTTTYVVYGFNLSNITNCTLVPGYQGPTNFLGALSWTGGSTGTSAATTLSNLGGVSSVSTATQTLAGGIISPSVQYPAINPSAAIFYGDSNTSFQPDNVTCLYQGISTCWVNRVSGYLNVTPTNYAVSGDQACDTSVHAFNNDSPNLLVPQPFRAVMIGTNDASKGAGAHEATFNTCDNAVLSWLTIPSSAKVSASTGSTTGTCANDTTYASSTGKTCTASGSTITLPITTTGGPIYIWPRYIDSDTGTWTYALDGGAATSVSTALASPISTNNGATSAPGMIRIAGVSAGAHTLLFTQTSSGSMAIIGAGTTPTGLTSSLPYLLDMTIFNRLDGDNQAATNAYRADISANFNLLHGDGLNLYYVPTDQFVPMTTAAGDSANLMHINGAGGGEVAQAVYYAVKILPGIPISSASYLTLTGGTLTGSLTGTTASFTSASTIALSGSSTSSYGVSGTSNSSVGVNGVSTSGIGVAGGSTSNFGLYGRSVSNAGAYVTQQGTLTGNTSSSALYVSRQSTLGSYTSTGAIIHGEDTTASTGNLLELVKQGTTDFSVDNTGVVHANNGIAGVTTGSAASSGNVGQVVSSCIVRGSGTALTSASTINFLTLSLTAGDWDVEGNVNLVGAALTATNGNFANSITTTSATVNTDGSEVLAPTLTMTTWTGYNSVVLPRKVVNVSSTTPTYLVVNFQGTITSGTGTLWGCMTARRVH
jgi:hypothetical protein